MLYIMVNYFDFFYRLYVQHTAGRSTAFAALEALQRGGATRAPSAPAVFGRGIEATVGCREKCLDIS